MRRREGLQAQALSALAAAARAAATRRPRQVKDRGLVSYGANDNDTYQQVASHIDFICKGAKPGDMPIRQPRTLHRLMNRETARTLGPTVPQTLWLRADEVIE